MATPPKVSAQTSSRKIFLFGEFNEEKSERVITSLLELEEKDPVKDIVMYIDSYGGIVDSAIAIHDVLKTIRCRVAGICVGKAMSAGCFLLMSCTKGIRFMTPNSRVMLHEISAGTWGSLSDMDVEIAEFKRQQKVMFDLMLESSGMSSKELSGYVKSSPSYIGAKEAVRIGVIDWILESPSDLNKKLSL
jgi:ATP-dependent Clp protease protease subunit